MLARAEGLSTSASAAWLTPCRTLTPSLRTRTPPRCRTALVCYVAVCTLSTMTTAKTFPTLLRWVNRLKGDHHIMYVRNAVACCPGVMDTKEFGKWAIDNHDSFMG